jgi:hypothetical protein
VDDRDEFAKQTLANAENKKRKESTRMQIRFITGTLATFKNLDL